MSYFQAVYGGTSSLKAEEAFLDLLSNIPDDREVNLDIETAFFDFGGWLILQKRLKEIQNIKIRLLLGSEMRATQSQIEEYNNTLIEEANQFVIDATNYITYLDMLTWLNNPNLEIEIRLVSKPMMHSKVALAYYDNSILYTVGSANITKAGLSENIETMISSSDRKTGLKLLEKFESKWEMAEDVGIDLVKTYSMKSDTITKEELINNTFNTANAELLGLNNNDYNVSEEWLKGLRRYQSDASKAIRNVIYNSRYKGIVLADDTGLGKSYIAMSIIAFNALYSNNNKKTLLICPASIKSNWRNNSEQKGYLDEMIEKFDNIAIKKAASKDYLDIESFNSLEKNIVQQEKYLAEDKYSLIIIDEAHKIRNRQGSWFKAVHNIIKNNPSAKILMMTATPYNNSVNDLYSLFDLIMDEENKKYWQEKYGFSSFPDKFKEVEKAIKNDEPFSHGGKNMWLTDLIKTFIIRRSVQYVKSNYPEDLESFPELKTIVKTYNLFDTKEKDLAFFKKIENLDFSYYALFSKFYKYNKKEIQERYKILEATKFVQVSFLKRLDSSLQAFKITLESYKSKIEIMRSLIQQEAAVPESFLKPEPKDLPDSDTEDDEATMAEEVKEITLTEEFFDITAYLSVLDKELEVIESLLAEINLNRNDHKRDALQEILEDIHRNCDGKDERKVLVFSEFADTTKEICITSIGRLRKAHLFNMIGESPEGSKYRSIKPMEGWMISGNTTSENKKKILSNISPNTNNKMYIKPQDEINILFTTDVLSEGVNLQQVKNIIQYDLPWNHAKSIQRVGRCLRFGSNHSEVNNYVLVFENISEFLRLGQVLEKKIQANANLMGADINPISETFVQNSSQVQEEIQNHGFIEKEEYSEKAFAEDTEILSIEDSLPVFSGCTLGYIHDGLIMTASIAYRDTRDLILVEFNSSDNSMKVSKNFAVLKDLTATNIEFNYTETVKEIFKYDSKISEAVRHYLKEIMGDSNLDNAHLNFDISIINFVKTSKIKDLLPENQINKEYVGMSQEKGALVQPQQAQSRYSVEPSYKAKSFAKLEPIGNFKYTLCNKYGYQTVLKYLMDSNAFSGSKRITMRLPNGVSWVAKLESGHIFREGKDIESIHNFTINCISSSNLSDETNSLYNQVVNESVWLLWYPKSQSAIGEVSIHYYISQIDEKDFEVWLQKENKKNKYSK